MIAFKCKMCGGELNITEGSNVCECEFCGTRQTIPTADNEKKVNLFNRANRLRMNAEFDKAATVYASVTAEFPEEAEAYWGLCLCKYGIEYVDDPLTGNKIPTCHRTLTTSIMDDADFDQACEYADPGSKRLYREEAKAIDRLQQDILNIVASEEPFDVFICYKETAEDGERTEDSVLAQEIYDALTGKGLKVFFSRITLEDKLGVQYEPYIYAALTSARVMLAVGTNFDYYDAVWVKNEWMRFLSMMKTDREKTLIPCYREIDAYDMPREFRNLQGQDMGKIGWLQDLTRGVLKLCRKDGIPQGPAPAVQVVQSGSPTVESLLRRASVFIEDRQWEDAQQYADRVLDLDVENGQAYLVKLMADLKVTGEEKIREKQEPFDDNANYRKILRFGDEALRSRIEGYAETVRLEKERLEKEIGRIRAEYEEARKAYNLKRQEKGRYEKAVEQLEEQIRGTKTAISNYKEARARLIGLFDGKRRREMDDEIAARSQKLRILEKEAQEEKEKLKKAGFRTATPPDAKEYYYSLASAYFNAKRYEEAFQEYRHVRGYKDTEEKIREITSLKAGFAAEPAPDSVIGELDGCRSASEMTEKLNGMGLNPDGELRKKMMDVLDKRISFERLYGVNHGETIAALKKIRWDGEND